jgi:hypothetical protein
MRTNDEKTITISGELYERIVEKAQRDSSGTVKRGEIKRIAELAIMAAPKAGESEN